MKSVCVYVVLSGVTFGVVGNTSQKYEQAFIVRGMRSDKRLPCNVEMKSNLKLITRKTEQIAFVAGYSRRWLAG